MYTLLDPIVRQSLPRQFGSGPYQNYRSELLCYPDQGIMCGCRAHYYVVTIITMTRVFSVGTKKV